MKTVVAILFLVCGLRCGAGSLDRCGHVIATPEGWETHAGRTESTMVFTTANAMLTIDQHDYVRKGTEIADLPLYRIKRFSDLRSATPKLWKARGGRIVERCEVKGSKGTAILLFRLAGVQMEGKSVSVSCAFVEDPLGPRALEIRLLTFGDVVPEAQAAFRKALTSIGYNERQPNQALQTTSVTRSGFGKVPVSDRQRRGV
jgi:hypothetical protein